MKDKEVHYRLMQPDDIEQIMEVEYACFPTPWTREAFHNELHQNEWAHYIVAEKDGKIVGYCGVWLIMDEGHITNIAVHPRYRRQNIGKTLLQKLILLAYSRGARYMTLEVRPSNHLARNLYEQFGFRATGRRKQYYADNNEDAIIMWASLNHTFAESMPRKKAGEQ